MRPPILPSVKRKLRVLLRALFNSLLKPGLASAYREMICDEKREKEAEQWCEGIIGDIENH